MSAKSYRWSHVAGVAFVVLFIVGVLMATGPQPQFKKHDSPTVAANRVFDAYGSGGHRAQMVIGAYLMVLSALALIWFATGLRARLVAAGRSEGGGLVFGFALLGAAAIGASALAFAAVAGGYVFGSEPLPTNADAIRVVSDFGMATLLVVFGLTSAALIAVVTVAAWRSALLPRWLTYAGILGILGGIGAVLFLPMALVVLWFLAVAITGLRSTPASVVETTADPHSGGRVGLDHL